MTQFFIESTDLAWLLASIGGWWVGCEHHRESFASVNHAMEHGYLRTRVHYAPSVPEGAVAFELTDEGMKRLGDLRGPDAVEHAERTRDWYRSRSSSPPQKVSAG